MKNCLILLFVLVCSLTSFSQSIDVDWRTIFDGNDLSEWEIPKNNVWWSIDEGVLWAKSDSDQVGSILWTKQKYKDFEVQLDFKFGDGIVDTGIYMRGDDSKNVQIQIGESGSLKRDMTGSPYVPSLGYPVEAEGIKELLKLNDWNTIRARAIGNTYTVWLNGERVMNYQLENANLTGPIGIQLHPEKEMTVQFKNISVAEL
tara:strand:- start:6386 stop:6991 length:606 start_codon:yes stop_codon:yes gene_type:complete